MTGCRHYSPDWCLDCAIRSLGLNPEEFKETRTQKVYYCGKPDCIGGNECAGFCDE